MQASRRAYSEYEASVFLQRLPDTLAGMPGGVASGRGSLWRSPGLLCALVGQSAWPDLKQ